MIMGARKLFFVLERVKNLILHYFQRDLNWTNIKQFLAHDFKDLHTGLNDFFPVSQLSFQS